MSAVVTAPSPRHLSSSADWGSPPALIDLARAVLGRIDLDPATDYYWNRVGVRASYFHTANGECVSWQVSGRPVTVFLNPPGDKSGQLVKAFWSRLVREWAAGVVDSAVWVGFSLEQLISLQHEQVNPCTLPMVVPRRRLAYLRPGKDGGPPVPAEQPTHGSYLTLLPSPDPERGRGQLDIWQARGRELGTVRI